MLLFATDKTLRDNVFLVICLVLCATVVADVNDDYSISLVSEGGGCHQKMVDHVQMCSF